MSASYDHDPAVMGNAASAAAARAALAQAQARDTRASFSLRNGRVVATTRRGISID